MRPGATWQDGEPVTSQDVLWTYRFVVQNDIGTLTSYFPFTTADSFSAPDDQTFVWKTSKPTTAPLYPSWVYILPEHIWSKLSVKQASSAADPVDPLIGSGPFQFDQWSKGQSWSLSANKNYWGGSPQIDHNPKYDNVEAMVNALKTGESTTPAASHRTCSTLNGVDITTNAGVPSEFAN
jgi:peptide/nickel transport system substrate-binding protein